MHVLVCLLYWISGLCLSIVLAGMLVYWLLATMLCIESSELLLFHEVQYLVLVNLCISTHSILIANHKANGAVTNIGFPS